MSCNFRGVTQSMLMKYHQLALVWFIDNILMKYNLKYKYKSSANFPPLSLLFSQPAWELFSHLEITPIPNTMCGWCFRWNMWYTFSLHSIWLSVPSENRKSCSSLRSRTRLGQKGRVTPWASLRSDKDDSNIISNRLGHKVGNTLWICHPSKIWKHFWKFKQKMSA